jgi:uncharacterized damage-inducible protein DinB
MISQGYCVMMARYNTWQNAQYLSFLEPLDPKKLTLDRKAFFGSILGTLNHLFWGDAMWMARFEGTKPPAGSIQDSPQFFATLGAWSEERIAMDARIERWAKRLVPQDIEGELTWYSHAGRRDMAKPMALCIAHFFNHQTHHRGQVHAMLTSAGLNAPVSDLFLMPE